MSDESSEAFEKNLKISSSQDASDDEKNDSKHNQSEIIDNKDVFGDELGDISDSDGDKSEPRSAASEHEANEEDADDRVREGDVQADEEEAAHEEEDEEGAEAEAEEERAEEDEEEAEEVIPVQLPQVKTDLTSSDVHFVKLPNFLSVEPRPFSHETYEDEMPKGEQLDEEGKTRVRLKVENTIRWKYEKDSEGNMYKQSNARMVKWSDGSMSLYLGNEIFDVYKTQMQGDHNHLFVRQGNWLHGQNVFRTKLTFRPYSTESLTHRKMTMSLVEHGSKTKKVKILTEAPKNPENKRQELLKQEEEKLKAASRRLNQKRRMREKAHSKGLSATFLEDRDQSDEEGVSLSDIKNKFKRGNMSQVSMDSTSGDDESDRERRLHKAKYTDDEDESARSGADNIIDDDEEDDDISAKKARQSKKKTRKVVVSDDED